MNQSNTNQNNFKYDLTIGMIFRNDIRYIRKCLETMQPLREACRCQLIMTDTGSTDGSRAVAEEFADVLLDFVWCDDFSAARNSGLEQAEGRWFAFFDCDHEFDESILEIAKFLDSKESHKADHGVVTVRNYFHDENYDLYGATNLALLFNFSSGIRYFENKIHENIPLHGKAGTIPTTVHHWGHTQQSLPEKVLRNEEYVERLHQENPGDMRHATHWIIISEDPEVRFQRSKIAIEEGLQEKSPDYARLFCIYTIQAVAAAQQGHFDVSAEMEKKLLDYMKQDPKTFTKNLYQLEFFGAMVQFYHYKKNPQKLASYFKQYHQLFHALKKNPDSKNYGVYPFRYCQDPDYFLSENFGISGTLEAGETDDARKYLRNSQCYTIHQPEGGSIYLPSLLKFCDICKEFSSFGKVYRHLLEKKYHGEAEQWKSAVENLLESQHPSHSAEILQSMAEEVVDAYTALCALRAKGYTSYPEKVVTALKSDPNLYKNPLYCSLIIGSLQNSQEPLAYLQHCQFELLFQNLPTLFQTEKNLAVLVESGFNNPLLTINSLQEEKLWAYLGMYTALHWSKSDNPDPKRLESLYQQASQMMYAYMDKIYNPAIFSDQGKNILPPVEMFCYYVIQSQQENNQVEKIKILKQGAEVCPTFTPVVTYFGKILQESAVVQTELSDLAKQVKKSIQSLIAMGQKEQAKQVLEKYKTIAPNDPDADTMLAQCN